MAGAVAVIHLVSPDRCPGNGIEQRRQHASREGGARQGDHAFEHARAILLLRKARVAHRHHAGDVGGAAQVLAARVDQQQTIALDDRM
ncbi:hypothetical protein D3C71_2095180 [compost metagenome]